MTAPSTVANKTAFHVTGDGGGGGGPGYGVIWKWNETDLTQFGSNLITPTAGTMTFSIQNNGRRPVIRGAASGFTGLAFLPITEMTFGANWQMTARFMSSSALSATRQIGVWFLSNGLAGASCYAVGFLKGNTAEWTDIARLEAGVVPALGTAQWGGATAWEVNSGDFFSMGFRRMSTLPLGGAPVFYAYTYDIGSGVGASASYRGCNPPVASWGAFGAGWTGQSALGTVGLAVRCTASTTLNFEWNDLVIYEEPVDY